MSGLETDRYEYSNLRCDSRNEGEKGPHNSLYKLRLCLHFLCTCPPPPLAANLCLATSDQEECLRLCQTLMGTELVSPHAFLLRNVPRTNTESLFLFAFIAQASVEMDRYRGLCCWYTPITTSLFLCSLLLVHVLRRPCLPAMTNIVASAHMTGVGLVTT
jgi:hypothetical protein